MQSSICHNSFWSLLIVECLTVEVFSSNVHNTFWWCILQFTKQKQNYYSSLLLCIYTCYRSCAFILDRVIPILITVLFFTRNSMVISRTVCRLFSFMCTWVWEVDGGLLPDRTWCSMYKSAMGFAEDKSWPVSW
jgi:hypothetical protein